MNTLRFRLLQLGAPEDIVDKLLRKGDIAKITRLLRTIGPRRRSRWVKVVTPLCEVVNEPGVYAIYVDDVLTYIGQTQHIGLRLEQHCYRLVKKNGGAVLRRLSFKYRIDYQHERAELQLLSRLKPIANQVVGVGKYALVDVQF